SSWLKRMHALTPIARAQPIDGGAQTRVGFRLLSPAPDAVMRASEMAGPIQIRQNGSNRALLSADLHELTGIRFILDPTDSMACDIPADISIAGLDIELVLSNEPRLTETIGGLLLIQPDEPAATQDEASVNTEVSVHPVMGGGLIATVSGAPTSSPGSEAFDV